jgi:peptide/nickel transport system substrate-binding protein
MKTQRLLLATALSALAFGAAPTLAANVVTMNTVQIFGTIDPAKISDYTDYMAAVNLYDGLVSVDAGRQHPGTGRELDRLGRRQGSHLQAARRCQVLRRLAGRGSDVVYSVERLLRINQGRPRTCSPDVLAPGSVTAVDAKTVKFTLSKTFAPFLTTVPAIMILNEEVVKANEGDDDGQTWLATNVAGAGAYSLKSWDRGSQMTITRNPDYYKGFGPGPIDEVRWIITNDEATVRRSPPPAN